MSGIGTAIVGSSLIGGGLNYLGAQEQANAARDAADAAYNAQITASANNAALQREAFAAAEKNRLQGLSSQNNMLNALFGSGAVGLSGNYSSYLSDSARKAQIQALTDKIAMLQPQSVLGKPVAPNRADYALTSDYDNAMAAYNNALSQWQGSVAPITSQISNYEAEIKAINDANTIPLADRGTVEYNSFDPTVGSGMLARQYAAQTSGLGDIKNQYQNTYNTLSKLYNDTYGQQQANALNAFNTNKDIIGNQGTIYNNELATQLGLINNLNAQNTGALDRNLLTQRNLISDYGKPQGMAVTYNPDGSIANTTWDAKNSLAYERQNNALKTQLLRQGINNTSYANKQFSDLERQESENQLGKYQAWLNSLANLSQSDTGTRNALATDIMNRTSGAQTANTSGLTNVNNLNLNNQTNYQNALSNYLNNRTSQMAGLESDLGGNLSKLSMLKNDLTGNAYQNAQNLMSGMNTSFVNTGNALSSSGFNMANQLSAGNNANAQQEIASRNSLVPYAGMGWNMLGDTITGLGQAGVKAYTGMQTNNMWKDWMVQNNPSNPYGQEQAVQPGGSWWGGN